jgi:hypothetical protein
MLPSAAALEQHFDSDTASMLPAPIERLLASGELTHLRPSRVNIVLSGPACGMSRNVDRVAPVLVF